jgi:tetratricopeptide (TPR) repeat protein
MRLSPLDRLGRAFTTGIAHARLIAGRYEEAIEWADRCLREEPEYGIAIRTKLVAWARLDRMEEAREGLRLLLKSQPGYTIARFEAFWAWILSPETLAVFVEGFRKAGLPEE